MLLLAGLWSCQGGMSTDAPDAGDAAVQAAGFVTPVEVMVVQRGVFTRELHSNGKLVALQKSRLSYPFSELLLQVDVVNGQRVEAGQQLALLCRDNLERQLEQARIRFARASLEMEDVLLGRGFTLADSHRVEAGLWRMAGIQSGYLEAAREVKSLEENLQKASLRAPFAGVVAGVNGRAFEKVSSGEVFCTLIDNSAFLAEFPVMEHELSLLAHGDEVVIKPFSGTAREYRGRVSSINPMVDLHGQVLVTALVTNARDLMDGMNVQVRVMQQVPGQLTVPKAAVLYRDNLEVLFKYTDGKAEWTYVNILQQNSTHYSVTANPDRVASLQPGDTVIVSGNMNLAHGGKVVIREP
jgi:membrane fusion protein, multidrug efflux system